jgi:hypothetical protein
MTSVPLFVNGEGMRGGSDIRDRFVPNEPPELELGVVDLEDGAAALIVFLRADVHAAGSGLTDISDHRSWPAYRSSQAS